MTTHRQIEVTCEPDKPSAPYTCYTRLRLEETEGRIQSTLGTVIRTLEALGYTVAIERQWDTLIEDSEARYLKYQADLDRPGGQQQLDEVWLDNDNRCGHEE